MADLEILEISKGEEGNTKTSSPPKQPSQLLHWFFTFNNYIQEDIEILTTTFKEFCYKYCFQEETGAEGTPHLQGVISLKKRMRYTELGLSKKIHWEGCKNVTKSYHYCSKKETRTGRIFAYNFEIPYEPPTLNLKDWQEDILDYLHDKRMFYKKDRQILWFWSRQGSVGKTTFAKYLFTTEPDCIVLSGKASDMKNAIVTYKKTNERLPKLIIVNIPRSVDAEFISYTGYEEVKDMFFFSGKYEGGMICGEPPHLLVFANQPPDEGKMSQDRWIVRNIDTQYQNITVSYD